MKHALMGLFFLFSSIGVFAQIAEVTPPQPLPMAEEMLEDSGSSVLETPALLDGGRILVGLLEFFITVALGIFVILFAHRILMSAARLDSGDLKKDKISAGILSASSVIGMTLIARSLLYPVFSLIHGQMAAPEGTGNLLLTLGFILGYLIIGFAVAFGTLFLALKVFDWMTKDLKEMKEIREGNVAVSIIFGAATIALSLFIQDGLNSLLVSLLPGLQTRLL